MNPIIIAGFGRSGTTWLSDIISKSLGGLILFEPFHPEVCRDAKKLIYQINSKETVDLAASQWITTNQKQVLNRWLLRNHLRPPIQKIPQTYIDQIWNECTIIGFKTIRINHTLSLIKKKWPASRLIYIIRHPLAVVASLQQRPNFWKEFGWEWHYEQFISALKHSTHPKRDSWIEQANDLRTMNERVVYLWTVSQLLSLEQVDNCGGLIIRYEDLYLEPFAKTRELLQYLDHSDRLVHPSYIFEPSMTTLRTFHNSAAANFESTNKLPEVFWEHVLRPQEAKRLIEIVKTIGGTNSHIASYLRLGSI